MLTRQWDISFSHGLGSHLGVYHRFFKKAQNQYSLPALFLFLSPFSKEINEDRGTIFTRTAHSLDTTLYLKGTTTYNLWQTKIANP